MPKTVFIPKYKTLYQQLKEDIASGQYRPGDKMPCERDLCQKYNAERATLRRALELLNDEQLIEKRVGIGSFVKAAEVSAPKATRFIVFSMKRNVNDIQHNVRAFNAMLFFSLERLCRARGYTLVYNSVEDDDGFVSDIDSQPPTGVLLISHHSAVSTEHALASGIPTVCVNHYAPDAISILPDNERGVRDGIRYLHERGHVRIGMITGDLKMINARERLNGYRHALYDLGIPADDSLIQEGAWTFESGIEAAQALIRIKNPPTAILASSDEMALGAMEAIRLAGLRVPEDISVMGFDNIDVSRYCSPALTTIGVSVEQIARLALDSLEASRQADAMTGYAIRTRVGIVERGSVGNLNSVPEER